MLFELPTFGHIDAKDISEAVACLKAHDGKAAVIAGATDLLSLIKDRIEGPKFKVPKVLVNIKTIPGIAGITYKEKIGLRIGAAVTLSQIMASEQLRARFDILSQAAQAVGTTQLRNMGTLGGNLCQRPRCAYFRHPHFVCFKKGGTRCYALAGEHRFYHAILNHGKCITAHPSDMAPALVALKASAVIAGPAEERKVPLRDFFVGPDRIGETTLTTGEFLLAIDVPDQPRDARQVFLKERIRHAADFALASVAVVACMSDGVCREISIVLELPVHPLVIMAIMQVVILIMGCFINSAAIILLTMPIFVPAIISLGFDPVWFGAISVLNIEIGLITPPFGVALYTMKAVAPPHYTLSDIIRSATPFIGIQVLAMALCIMIPSIVLWLPGIK